MNNRTILVIGGPTATGKTSLCIFLAKALGGEIVSADSMQVYRGMDIGTAKATAQERAAVPHHMLDVADPSEDYSVSRYVEDASYCCDKLLEAEKLPVLVGGTGLYIDSLVSGRRFCARESDGVLRAELNHKYDLNGGDAMLSELRKVDPERAAILHPSDRRRIIRALEIYLITGETITEHDRQSRLIPPRYHAVYLIPGFHNRSFLYARINDRVNEMIQMGLFSEVKKLISSGVPAEATSMQAIGYKEVVSCLYGKCTEEEAVEQIKNSSRRYAKRQLTWFARYQEACRLFHDDFGGTDALFSEALRFSYASLKKGF